MPAAGCRRREYEVKIDEKLGSVTHISYLAFYILCNVYYEIESVLNKWVCLSRVLL